MNKKQKLEKATKFVEEGNIPNYFELMQSEVGENATLSLLKDEFMEGKQGVGFDKRLISVAQTFFDEKASKDRKELLEGLAVRYQKRLDKKLEENLFQNIEVDLEYTTKGTSEKYIETYFIEKETQPTGDFQKLFERYVTELKSLLVLGEAGSGKTVLLLRMGKALVELAKKDALYPVPVLVNLASWRENEKDFKTWLANVLVFSAGESGIAKDYAKELVAENNLLLLLDGLDEIPEAHRSSCLEAFRNYAKDIDNNRSYYPKWVIGSRKNEYEHTAQDAFVQASVLFKPLTDEKIQATLLALSNKEKNMAAKALLKQITDTPTITEHFRTAFELHLALKLAHEEDFRATHLVEDFIDKELKTVTPAYPKAKHYLSFLANQMQATKKGITFELIDMQPSWLAKEWKFGLIYGFTIGFVIGIDAGIIYGFIFGFISGVGFHFLHESIGNNILISETIRLHLHLIKKDKVLNNLKEAISFGFIATLILGTKLGLTIGVTAIIVGVTNAIFTFKRNSTIGNPYQRLYASFIFDCLLFTISYLLALIIYVNIYKKMGLESISWWVKIPLESITRWHYLREVGTGFLIALLNSPLLKHFVLRFLLWQEGKIPLRWVSFLNGLDKKTGLIEKDGGQWRFRHQLLQEALAAQYKKAF